MKTRFVILFFVVLFFISCAPAMRVNYFSNVPRFPPTSPASVDLIRYEPPRPHFAIAEIIYNPPAVLSRLEVESRLKEKGAAIGAHALVIEVDNIFRERVWVGPYRVHRRVYRDRVIVGIAIRYR